MNCASLALHNASPWPEQTAALPGIQSLSNHGTLAEPIADAMREHFGIRARDRVAMMMMYDRPEFAEVLVTISRAGAIAVPLNAKLNHATHVNACSGVRLMFAAPEFSETAALIAAMVPGLEIVLVGPSAEYDRLVAPVVGPVEPIWRAADNLPGLSTPPIQSARQKPRPEIVTAPL
jgi:acyl-CoA synthetase (AMP-forming)/AMP-acid ligase II